MNRTPKIQTSSGRRVALWALVAILALLLALDAGAQRSRGAEGQSPIPNPQSPTSSRTIIYAYAAAGRLTQANYGGGAGLAYSYDAAGNLMGVSPGGGRGLYLPLIMR